ncbi:hypothetical protein ISF_03238 [Cordyceps fumosorosea ARSEF 2679]|uniref:Mitochondrial K+-H+ exchange-related-domain-containing protein n=1 Tax=Cordyceps fumosorosea (strain ARSEF 2679) TaxID=1081104 RepID=A0A168AK64_CORFA|nr:hypothetical protein ISF_03238 [Cordyceps fumosorosea ARSEF 2679]OAA68863.1 hypothetical protein ISF_03238 [Cordyceps fumosorosea ARSEF 2679]
MRLFLVPVSTRRTLLYAQRLGVTTKEQAAASPLDRAVAFAARTWAGWEKRERGWQRRVVDYGNHAFRRIPFPEWGLKSVPPLSARRRAEELAGRDDGGKVEVVFPASVIPEAEVESVARRLATERQALHRRQMMWCFAGMPITLPFALVPVIPNLPFFYLAYRAFSNWRAIAGGKHVQWLLDNKLLVPAPSKALDLVYAQSRALVGGGKAKVDPEAKEEILLTHAQIRTCTDALGIPELETELDRAVWQIEEEFRKEEQKKQAGASSSPSKPPEEKKTGANDNKKNQ